MSYYSSTQPAEASPQPHTPAKTERFNDPIIQTIAEFLHSIGITVRNEKITEDTFLPGIKLADGGLVVDESLRPYPGDLLHEAGHLAVMPPERRRETYINAGHDAAEEMMAIAWSYAAIIHLGIEPTVLFHDGGYRGWSQSLIENFGEGRYIAVPMLQWLGLSAEPPRAREMGVQPYPHMVKWLLD